MSSASDLQTHQPNGASFKRLVSQHLAARIVEEQITFYTKVNHSTNPQIRELTGTGLCKGGKTVASDVIGVLSIPAHQSRNSGKHTPKHPTSSSPRHVPGKKSAGTKKRRTSRGSVRESRTGTAIALHETA